MPDRPIGNEQVRQISKQLERIQDQLSSDEAAMLSGIFSVAADAIRPSGEGRGKTSLVSESGDDPSAMVRIAEPVQPIARQFIDQFEGAFSPDPPAPAGAMSAMIIPGPPPEPPRSQAPAPGIIPRPGDQPG